jgi:hypothetical protein
MGSQSFSSKNLEKFPYCPSGESEIDKISTFEQQRMKL